MPIPFKGSPGRLLALAVLLLSTVFFSKHAQAQSLIREYPIPPDVNPAGATVPIVTSAADSFHGTLAYPANDDTSGSVELIGMPEWLGYFRWTGPPPTKPNWRLLYSVLLNLHPASVVHFRGNLVFVLHVPSNYFDVKPPLIRKFHVYTFDEGASPKWSKSAILGTINGQDVTFTVPFQTWIAGHHTTFVFVY